MNIMTILQWKKPIDQPARMVFKDTVYFQPFDGSPICVEESYATWLQGDGQPFNRRMQVTEEWQPVDCQWITDPGVILLQNMEGMSLEVNPTEQMIQEINSRIIEVSFSPENPIGHLWIPPMGCQRLRILDINFIRIRCQYQQARCQITAFPR